MSDIILIIKNFMYCNSSSVIKCRFNVIQNREYINYVEEDTYVPTKKKEVSQNYHI